MILDSIMLIIRTCFLYSIFIHYSFLDCCYRRIPNKIFYIYLINGILINLFELKNGYFFVFNITFLLLFFGISYFLFEIRILGGADCKLIILTFLFSTYRFYSFNFLFFFYFFFSVYYIGLVIMRLITNMCGKNRTSFKILINTSDNDTLKQKLFIIGFFVFKPLKEMKKVNFNKYNISNSDLIFNFEALKIQVLVQYRPPLVPILILTYFSSFMVVLN